MTLLIVAKNYIALIPGIDGSIFHCMAGAKIIIKLQSIKVVTLL